MIGRRPFLIGSVGLAATPIFARPEWPTTATLGPKSAAGSPAPAAWADSAEANDAVLRIHGWDAAEDPSGASHGQAWIHVNSSWRAAWR